MKQMKSLPANYQTVMPYLIVDNAAAFSLFMQEVFNATETHRTNRSAEVIMHGEVMTGGSTIMFADSTSEFQARTAGMFIYVEDADKTFNKALEHGATAIMPPADQPYGRSGGITDPFGNTWWITSL